MTRRCERHDAADLRIGVGRGLERAPAPTALPGQHDVAEWDALLAVKVLDRGLDVAHVVDGIEAARVADLGEDDHIGVPARQGLEDRWQLWTVGAGGFAREPVVVNDEDRLSPLGRHGQFPAHELALDREAAGAGEWHHEGDHQWRESSSERGTMGQRHMPFHKLTNHMMTEYAPLVHHGDSPLGAAMHRGSTLVQRHNATSVLGLLDFPVDGLRSAFYFPSPRERGSTPFE